MSEGAGKNYVGFVAPFRDLCPEYDILLPESLSIEAFLSHTGLSTNLSLPALSWTSRVSEAIFLLQGGQTFEQNAFCRFLLLYIYNILLAFLRPASIRAQICKSTAIPFLNILVQPHRKWHILEKGNCLGCLHEKCVTLQQAPNGFVSLILAQL